MAGKDLHGIIVCHATAIFNGRGQRTFQLLFLLHVPGVENRVDFVKAGIGKLAANREAPCERYHVSKPGDHSLPTN